MKHFPQFPAESGLGYVYFSSRCDGLYKLGQTEDVERRINQHKSTDFSFEVAYVRETVEYKACEEFLKAVLGAKRKNGTKETFSITKQDIELALSKALHYAESLHNCRKQLEQISDAPSRTSDIPASEEFLEMHDRLKDICSKIHVLQSEADLIKLHLAIAIGENAGIQGLISYRTSEVRYDLVDRGELAEILRIERQDLYERFYKPLATFRPFKIL